MRAWETLELVSNGWMVYIAVKDTQVFSGLICYTEIRSCLPANQLSDRHTIYSRLRGFPVISGFREPRSL